MKKHWVINRITKVSVFTKNGLDWFPEGTNFSALEIDKESVVLLEKGLFVEPIEKINGWWVYIPVWLIDPKVEGEDLYNLIVSQTT